MHETALELHATPNSVDCDPEKPYVDNAAPQSMSRES